MEKGDDTEITMVTESTTVEERCSNHVDDFIHSGHCTCLVMHSITIKELPEKHLK